MILYVTLDRERVGERAGRKQNITSIVSSVSDLILMLERKLIKILKKLF